ncbi:MAG: hypothetical protein JWO05_1445 [Gemmatimonadetes bacterium]|nr:hypothetical protein [Gemmatimonadota bacterium]
MRISTTRSLIAGAACVVSGGLLSSAHAQSMRDPAPATQQQATPDKKPIKQDRYKITREELAEYGASNLFDVVSRARPQMMVPPMNGGMGAGMRPQVQVFLEGQAMGTSDALKNYTADRIKEVRYYKPSEAVVRLNVSDGAAVIQLIPVDALHDKP